MSEINFNFIEENFPQRILRDVAKLYCNIFSEFPWDENWDEEEVLGGMKKELQKPFARMVIAVAAENDKAIGFSWGYEVSESDLLEISGNSVLVDFIFRIPNRVFYIDELGVAPSFRGKGIGKKISQILLEYAKKSGFSAIVLRTDIKAKAARVLYKELGFTELMQRDAVHQERSYWILKF